MHGQRLAVSQTAEYGGNAVGPAIVPSEVKENMKAALSDIRSGAFSERFIADQDAGAPESQELRARSQGHPIEPAGRVIRDLIPWL